MGSMGHQTSHVLIENNSTEMTERMSQLQKSMNKLLQQGHLGRVSELAPEYFKLTEIIAENKFKQLGKKPSKISKITIKMLCELHSTFFPKGHPFAGKFRSVKVYISNSRETHIGTVIGDTSGDYFKPPLPEVVLEMLEELLHTWNSHFSELTALSVIDRVRSLSKFHHKFTQIHPFMDGNGRLSRLLLGMQIADLFDVEVDVTKSIDRANYYKALEDADGENLLPLVSLIKGLIET